MSILFTQVNVVLQNTHILHDVSLDLQQKRIVCIGCNGSGKSTLARAACGLIPLASGNVSVYGKKITKQSIWKNVNMCFQIPERQIIMPSVEEELRFGLVNAQFSDEVIETKIQYALSILKIKAKQPCHTLSEGKKRMLCVLSVVLLEPKSIFLDEPTTFLDMPSKKILFGFLEKLEQQIIFITQDMDIVKTFSHAFCIHKGSIHTQGDGVHVVKQYKKLW